MGKSFNLFNRDPNKGISKESAVKNSNKGFASFFSTFKNRFSIITISSIIFSICNFPFFLFLLGLSGNFDSYTTTPTTPLFAQIYGLRNAGSNNLLLSGLETLFGQNSSLQIVSTASHILQYCIILLAITLGLSTIGICYNLREVTRGESVSTFSDFFITIKKNILKGTIVSVLDAVVIFFLYYDILVYYSNMKAGSNFLIQMSFYLILIISILYYQFRFYVYLNIVTFEMKFKTILKNALYLLFLGWKRNVCGLIGAFVSIILMYYIYLFFPSVGILLPVIIGFGFLNYIGVFTAFPVINKYIIQPYYKDHPDEDPDQINNNVETIFTDHG